MTRLPTVTVALATLTLLCALLTLAALCVHTLAAQAAQQHSRAARGPLGALAHRNAQADADRTAVLAHFVAVRSGFATGALLALTFTLVTLGV